MLTESNMLQCVKLQFQERWRDWEKYQQKIKGDRERERERERERHCVYVSNKHDFGNLKPI